MTGRSVAYFADAPDRLGARVSSSGTPHRAGADSSTPRSSASSKRARARASGTSLWPRTAGSRTTIATRLGHAPPQKLERLDLDLEEPVVKALRTDDVGRRSPFTEPFELNEQKIQLSVRVGVALYPEDAEDANALLNGAETALARAKQSGEAYLRHHASMNAQAAERLSLTSRLRQVVAHRSFQLHYQPKTSLASDCVEGVEALLRWRDESGSFIPPARFVPMLEAEGLIDEVGHWAIERALEETESWKAANGAPLSVAVNVSPVQFRRAEFARTVLGLVKRPSDRARLELEITESMLMDNVDATIAMLVELREAGISIQIDDFGTGYSSLRVLSRLPVDALKIDRSFVSQLDSGVHGRTVVQTTISLADALGLKTIGEGVETKQQLDVLRELGCASVQGYLVRAPLPAGELREWLARTGGRLPSELTQASRPASEASI